jgi:hypothetical protein
MMNPVNTIGYNPGAISGTHTLTFRTRDSHRDFPVRNVEVLATEAEVEQFVRDGYLVRPNLLKPDDLALLRAALEEVAAHDDTPETGGGRAFGGMFLRHLHDKHPAFLGLIGFAPALSVARALFGPSVALRGFTARIVPAESKAQETEWHFHQRVIPDPIPPMFQAPQVMDCLLYLDDARGANGPLCVVPGSHQWQNRDLARSEFGDMPGQVVLELSAGSCVLAHGNLWHRALPTQPGATIRRLLLFGYSPAWQKPAIYGKKPENGLTAQLLQQSNPDEETRELLGNAGYM